MKRSGPSAKTPTKSSGSPTPEISTRSHPSAGATSGDSRADPGSAPLSSVQEDLLERLLERYRTWIASPAETPPPTAVQFLGDSEAKIVVVPNSSDRVDIVRTLAQLDPQVTGVALICDAWISEMDPEAECSCEGRGCEDCRGLGKALTRKREALMELVWTREAGAWPARFRYQPYARVGADRRPVFEEVTQLPEVASEACESLYGDIWREPPRREGRLREWPEGDRDEC